MLMRPHILGRCSDEWASLWALHPSLVAYRPVQEQFLHDADISRQLVNTRALAQVNANRYDAVLFVGGHGVMWDFPNNSVVNAVGRNIWERGGIVPWACGIGGYDVVGWQLSDCRQAGHRIHQRRRAKSPALSVAAAGE